MSQGAACKDPAHRSQWVVVQRNCNHSAFNGYRATSSAFSGVRCLECGTFWRTDAQYVTGLPDAVGDEGTRNTPSVRRAN